MEIFFSNPQDACSVMEQNETGIIGVWKGANNTGKTATLLPPNMFFLRKEGETSSSSVR